MQNSNTLLFSIVHWFVSALAILLTSKIISGFRVSGWASALFAAVIIALATPLIWPLLIFLTLPINILTLGLFTFIVNGAVLKISAIFIPGFNIDTWLAAIFGSIVLSLLNILLHSVIV